MLQTKRLPGSLLVGLPCQIKLAEFDEDQHLVGHDPACTNTAVGQIVVPVMIEPVGKWGSSNFHLGTQVLKAH